MAGLKALIARARAIVRPYFVHASGQAMAWYTIAEHDLSKWEAGAAAVGAAALTSAIKKINGWLGTTAT